MLSKRPCTSMGLIAGLTCSLLVSVSCGDVVRQGRSPAFLVIDSLTAASGATPDEFGSVLSSDVLTLVERTIDGEKVRVPTIFGDNGQVQMRIALKDPGVPGAPTAASPINAITVTRYHVEFRRSDGHNLQGVDVPFAFDGAATATIGETVSTFGFVLVRNQAKDEAPLRALTNGGGPGVISTIADITFFGRDQAGNEAMVTGSISVNFADWGDPE